MSIFLSRSRCRKDQDHQAAKYILAKAVDKSDGFVDLSNLFLMELPEEIKDLKHLVWVTRSQIITHVVQLFLADTCLLTFPKELLNLDNLTVLVLKNNYMRYCPAQINKLVNLEELSLSHNLIKSFPHTLLELKKLQIFLGSPNPLITDGLSHNGVYWLKHGEEPLDLKEICLRSLDEGCDKINKVKSQCPPRLNKKLNEIHFQPCPICNKKVYQSDHEALIYLRFCKPGTIIPFSFKFCSATCAGSMDWDAFHRKLNPVQFTL